MAKNKIFEAPEPKDYQKYIGHGTTFRRKIYSELDDLKKVKQRFVEGDKAPIGFLKFVENC